MSRQIAHKCISIQSFSVLGVLFRQLLCFKNSLGDFKLQFPEFYPCDWSLFRFNLSRLGSLISEIRLGGSKSPTGIAQGPSCARAKKYPKSQERLFVDLFRPWTKKSQFWTQIFSEYEPIEVQNHLFITANIFLPVLTVHKINVKAVNYRSCLHSLRLTTPTLAFKNRNKG